MMVDCFHVISTFHQFSEIIFDEIDIVDVTAIKEKLIYINIQKSYVVSRPNKFEKD